MQKPSWAGPRCLWMRSVSRTEPMIKPDGSTANAEALVGLGLMVIDEVRFGAFRTKNNKTIIHSRKERTGGRRRAGPHSCGPASARSCGFGFGEGGRLALDSGMPATRKPHRPHVSFGSKPEVSDGHENVRSWGSSGSRFRATGCLLVAISGHSPLLEGGRNRAHRDAGGGSHPLHHKQSFMILFHGRSEEA